MSTKKRHELVKILNPSRLKNSKILPWRALLGWVLKLAAALLPSLVARIIELSFTRTRRFEAPKTEREAIASGTPFRVPFEYGELQAWSWGSGPVVLLVHGWAGRGSQLHAFIPPLLRAGFTVVAFDGPGHGASPGKHTNLIQFSGAIRTVSEKVGGAVAIIGHSFGAASTAHAVKNGLKAKCLVFFASPANPATFFDGYSDHFAIPISVRKLVRRDMERRYQFDWSNLGLEKIGPEMRTPLAVFHDRSDKDVPYSDAMKIAESWPGAELHLSDGLGHRRILRAREQIDRAVEFIRRHT